MIVKDFNLVLSQEQNVVNTMQLNEISLLT